jgi:GT2 family glycosyltransferase
MRIGVVVLHFRNWPAVLETIGDVIDQSVDARVVLVDNGSGIPELESAVRRAFPNIALLALPENIGYAAGMNAGVQSLGGEADMILLITHECRMAPDTLRLLADHLASSPGVAMVGPLLVSKKDGSVGRAGASKSFPKPSSTSYPADVARGTGLPVSTFAAWCYMEPCSSALASCSPVQPS